MKEKHFDFFPCNFTRFSLADESGENGFFIPSPIFTELAEKAFKRLSFTFTEEHLNALIDMALAPDSSQNDRHVAVSLLENAQISSRGLFALCQDTGIANIFGWKDGRIFCKNEHNSLEEGVRRSYKENNLRFSTVCPSSFFSEYDPHDNLPAQIMLFQNTEKEDSALSSYFRGKPAYRFLFCAKGGGSSNKTAFIQATKAFLNEASFEKFLEEQITKLGTAACPPYTIAVVAGGLSPEQNQLTLKLATCGFYDNPDLYGQKKETENGEKKRELPFRDSYWENRVLDIAKKTGFGAQFGGKGLALKAVVLRLARHGASCPLSIGVSCSAHRNLDAYITEDGWYLEKTCENPALLPRFDLAIQAASDTENALSVNTDRGIRDCLSVLTHAKPGSKFLLSGTVIVARDQAHAKWKKLIDDGKPLPDYCAKYPVFYAGPAETPPGKPLGSFGPTTAGRMDSYADTLMSRDSSLITLAKGNRSLLWTEACKKYGAVYLGVTGGAAALIADKHIVSSKIIDYPELGMEAVRLVEIRELPVFMLTNALGEDFYALIERDKMPR